MKQKITLLMAVLCLMAMSMAAQPKQPQRACDVVKMEQQKGKAVYTPAKQVSKNASEAQQQGNFRYYNPQQSPILTEGGSTDTATVTLMYNLQEEELGNYYVGSVMVYNPEWSQLWHPDMYTQAGNLSKGIIVKVPFGTYDLYTNTYGQQGDYRQLLHIDELVTIDKDTTIYLNVLDVQDRVCWELYDNNNQLLVPQTIRPLDQDPWYEVIEDGNLKQGRGILFLRLDGYGNVSELSFGYGGKPEGQAYGAAFYYVNKLSDRYNYVVDERTLDFEGMIYINKLTCGGAGPFPLRNDASGYVVYEEQIQRTPKGIKSVENPTFGVASNTYLDNSSEYFGDAQSDKSVGDDGMARVMINAAKSGQERLEGVNLSVLLRVKDWEQWVVNRFEYVDENGNPVVLVDSMLNWAAIVGPEVMINQDRSLECLVHSGVMRTSEIGIWKEDYPPHPMFSYAYEQKKGIIGNNCPLVSFDSRNAWNQWRNANMIIMFASHVGRNGEQIGSGDLFSTMTAKYNGEQIYSGKHALDSLRMSWVGVKPDGNYEFEFTNENVAVDGIPGKNVTTVYFDQTKEDQNPPLLTMLQFRDAENNVTDRFDMPDGGTIMFAGGDFDPRSITYMTEYGYESNWDYKECQPMTVEVSYAPYGSDEWQPLEGIEHQEEYDDIPGMGFFYQGSLSSVNRESENGWFDLKFRLVDEAGNWQEQTLSPAFRIDNLVQSAVTEVRDGSAHELARYSIDGKRIDGSHHGIVIVKMSDGTARKVLVP
ncbi:MAG: hypothetical protein IJ613_01715 [Muribaculaceae bacterium]|nr:hypothetical protein [Muribaculaceae bacterium]